MLALKKLNNNAVVCKDSVGRELIATGKGLGFGTLPREVSLEEIERTFYDTDPSYRAVLQELPTEVVSLAGELVDIAANELPYELSPNLVLTLADHIAFAAERARKQMHVRMPLAYDVEQHYPAEYKLGKYALQRIRRELQIGLPPNEAVGIALNFVNGKAVPESAAEARDATRDEEMLEKITETVERHFKLMINRETFSFSRYATHMQYLFERVHAGETLNSDNLQIYRTTRQEFPEIAACAEEIGDLLHKEWGAELTEEEKLYLMMHINRICVKEGL